MINGHESFWQDDLGPQPRRPRLRGTVEADIAIVGGGFTGLWTAYYLRRLDPGLRIVIVEARHCGFGASGRNGGWLTSALAGSRPRYAQTHGRDAVLALERVMVDSVSEVIDVAGREGIDADVARAGVLSVAVNRAQRERQLAADAEDRRWDVSDHVVHDAAATQALIAVAGAVGSRFWPHAARIHPAKLVRGLAAAVERSGVAVYEDSPVTELGSGYVRTAAGRVRADVIVRATEGFTARLPGLRRTWLPMNSCMIVTEPLPERVWDDIGWVQPMLLGDEAHAYIYAQRTADDRIALGGRGVPYRFASRTDSDGVVQARAVRGLTAVLHRYFPATRSVAVTHGWAGVLGVPRDWCATVGYDAAAGHAWAGGYTGHGVATANLAGRTLADLITGRDTARAGLPWVGRQVRRWEPEPLRWLGVHAMYAAYRTADRREQRGGSTSVVARVADRISGRP